MFPDRHHPGDFATTQWDLVFAAAQNVAHPSQFARGPKALEELCSLYRAPIVAFCEYQLRRPKDAEDIAQAFLSEVAQGKLLSSADQKKGRFRNLVVKALKRFVFDLRDREQAEKRGGHLKFVPLSEVNPQHRAMAAQGGLSAELFFDVEWAKALIRQSLARLRARQPNPKTFDLLEPFLTVELGGLEAENVARSLGWTVLALHLRLHRLRRDYTKAVRREVASTVSAPNELETELAYLRDVVSRCQLLV